MKLTPPCGWRLSCVAYRLRLWNYFNSHSHAGGDLCPVCQWRRSLISTHTPTRGATMFLPSFAPDFAEFQLTPPRGGRRFSNPLFVIRYNFNSHPHVGGDMAFVKNLAVGQISTHTPTWRATENLKITLWGGKAFQLTPPRGGRLVIEFSYLLTLIDFNSHPHAGGDKCFFRK